MNLDKEKFAEILRRVADQAFNNIEKYGKFSSNHEVYGVLCEEFAEYFDQVREYGTNESFDMGELVDIAAVAIHAAVQMLQYQEVRK